MNNYCFRFALRCVLALSVVATMLTIATNVHARLVTLVTNNSTNVAELRIQDYEVAELVSFPSEFSQGGVEGNSRENSIEIEKSQATFRYFGAPAVGLGPNIYPSKPPLEPLIIVGPAVIRLMSRERTQRYALCTFKITPESYPPDKAIIVLPGTNGASITLECSTNLANWLPATNGIYNNLNEARFFRIRTDRLP